MAFSSVSLELVSLFGFTSVFFGFTVYNFVMIVFVRERYLRWLDSKKPSDFNVDLSGIVAKAKND